MPYKTFKDKSREGYGREFCGNGDQNVTWQEIRDGCLQRIADAAEKMAMNHQALIEERDRYQKWYEQCRETKRQLHRRIAALQGVITKLKKAKGGMR